MLVQTPCVAKVQRVGGGTAARRAAAGFACEPASPRTVPAIGRVRLYSPIYRLRKPALHQHLITEPNRSTAVLGNYEVVVLGGGPAGIAAALAAGRKGRSTLLIERYGFMGGAGTAAGLSTFCGLHAVVHGKHEQVVHGIADDILARLAAMDGLNKPHLTVRNKITAQAYDISAFKIAADELMADAKRQRCCSTRSGSAPCCVRRTDRRRCWSRPSRAVCGTRRDCSSTARATATSRHGRACPTRSATARATCCIRRRCFASTAWIRRRRPGLGGDRRSDGGSREAGRTFPRKKPIVRPQRNPIEWRANLTQIKNPNGSAVSGIDARSSPTAKSKGAGSVGTCSDSSKRRRPVSRTRTSSRSLRKSAFARRAESPASTSSPRATFSAVANFDDSIGVNGWPVEAHVKGDVKFVFTPPGSRGFNQIPYRIIVPKKVENLFVVGRCASMSHEGQSSARVSGSCFVMGQAAGTAADLALRGKIPPRRVDVGALQRQLAEDGAFLGTANADAAGASHDQKAAQ